jgi:hypothetical protein
VSTRAKRKRAFSALFVSTENLAGFVAGDVCHFATEITNFIECYNASSAEVVSLKSVCGVVPIVVNRVSHFFYLLFFSFCDYSIAWIARFVKRFLKKTFFIFCEKSIDILSKW